MVSGKPTNSLCCSFRYSGRVHNAHHSSHKNCMELRYLPTGSNVLWTPWLEVVIGGVWVGLEGAITFVHAWVRTDIVCSSQVPLLVPTFIKSLTSCSHPIMTCSDSCFHHDILRFLFSHWWHVRSHDILRFVLSRSWQSCMLPRHFWLGLARQRLLETVKVKKWSCPGREDCLGAVQTFTLWWWWWWWWWWWRWWWSWRQWGSRSRVTTGQLLFGDTKYIKVQ